MTRALFIHPPFAGGTSAINALKHNREGIVFAQQTAATPLPATLPDIIGFSHATLAWLLSNQIITLDYIRDWFVFAVMRNPWARLVSGYFAQYNHQEPNVHTFIRRKGPDFPTFVEWVVSSGELLPINQGGIKQVQWANPQVDWYTVDGKCCVDAFLRTEQLASDWRGLRIKLGVPKTNIGHGHKGRHPPYRTLYTKRMKQLIGDFYAADIELGGYMF